MAPDGWSTAAALTSALLSRGWEFDFTQAVALLERLLALEVRPGHSGPHSMERLRFCASPRLAPSASQIRSIADEGDPEELSIRMTVAFFGLCGMSAPGPAYLIEAAADPRTAEVLRDFLNVFNDRLIALFYRANRKYRWPLEFQITGNDPDSRRVFAMMGLGTPADIAEKRAGSLVVEQASLDPLGQRTGLLRYLGPFSQRVRCPANLRGVLWHFFEGPDHRTEEFIEIVEFAPRWLPIGVGRRCRLGVSNSRLGGQKAHDEELIMGQRIRDALGQFRVVIGPLEFEEFASFLPGGPKWAALLALVDLVRPDRLDYEVRLRLSKVPGLHIGRASSQKLGWSTWLQSPDVERVDEGIVDFDTGPHSRVESEPIVTHQEE
ncbi:MAG: type VI secretion system baseplate subunit TssG [bacterium]|nr:type VI secretion system baseplate subunit TssG [bacterium]